MDFTPGTYVRDHFCQINFFYCAFKLLSLPCLFHQVAHPFLIYALFVVQPLQLGCCRGCCLMVLHNRLLHLILILLHRDMLHSGVLHRHVLSLRKLMNLLLVHLLGCNLDVLLLLLKLNRLLLIEWNGLWWWGHHIMHHHELRLWLHVLGHTTVIWLQNLMRLAMQRLRHLLHHWYFRCLFFVVAGSRHGDGRVF